MFQRKERRKPYLRAPEGYIKLKDTVGSYAMYYNGNNGAIAVLTAPAPEHTRQAFKDEFREFKTPQEAQQWYQTLQQAEAVEALAITPYIYHRSDYQMEGYIVHAVYSFAEGKWVEVSPHAEKRHTILRIKTEEIMQEGQIILDEYNAARKAQQDAEEKWREFVQKKVSLLPTPEKKV